MYSAADNAATGCASRFLPVCLILFMFVCSILIVPEHAPAAGDPRSCIQDLIKAVDNADPDAFEKRVDIEAVTRQIFDELEVMASMDEYASAMPPVLSLLASQGAFSNTLARQLLLNEVRSFVRYGVGSGAFAGKKVENFKRESVLTPLFEMVSMGRKEITSVGRPLMTRDGRWVAPFSVLDHENGNTYYVRAVCAPVSDGWRMVAIENLRMLIIQIMGESQEGRV